VRRRVGGTVVLFQGSDLSSRGEPLLLVVNWMKVDCVSPFLFFCSLDAFVFVASLQHVQKTVFRRRGVSDEWKTG